MGIIYDGPNGSWIECRTKSVTIAVDEDNKLEVDHKELDTLEHLIKEAQKYRRDKGEDASQKIKFNHEKLDEHNVSCKRLESSRIAVEIINELK